MSLTLVSVGRGKVSVAGGGGGGVAPTAAQVVTEISGGAEDTKDLAFTSVGADNLITIAVFAYNGGIGTNLSLTTAMLTKTAGGATIGTVALDIQTDRVDIPNLVDNIVGIWSVPVTAAGDGTLTLTVNLGTFGASTFMGIGGVRWTGADVSGARLNATASANSLNNTAVVSGGVATGGAGMIFAVMTPGSPYGAIVNTPDAAFTDHASVEGDNPTNGGIISLTSAVNVTDSGDWTLDTTSQWIVAAAAYKSATP